MKKTVKDIKPKYEIKGVVKIDYHELERIIGEYFGAKNYSFVADQECGNDSSHSFYVDGDEPDFDKNELKKWSSLFMTQSYLEVLVRKGILPKAEYLIDVCW